MVDLQWREVKGGERGFQLAPEMRGREYVLQYRESKQRMHEPNTYIPAGEWIDVQIEAPNKKPAPPAKGDR